MKLLITGVLLLLSVVLFAKVPIKIVKGLNEGNEKLISAYFQPRVEIQILENSCIYSKAHGQQIMRKFFDQNKVIEFKIKHDGQKDGAHYAIGILSTVKQDYRVYILLKESDDAIFIHQLRIENN